MSRVGNKIINVPEGVTVDIADDNTVTVTGPKGTLVRQFSPVITIKQEENVITVVEVVNKKLKTITWYNKSFTCKHDRRCSRWISRKIRNRWYWISWSNERKYVSIKYWFLSSS